MKSIGSALLAAQTKMGGVGKDAKNSFANYDYVSAEAMITACRKALHKSALLFSRTHWTVNEECTIVTSKYVLMHPESGETMELTNDMVIPQQQKQIDKASLAALTTGMNYTLRDLLLIPRCESEQPEVDTMPSPSKAVSKAAAKKSKPKGKALSTGDPGLVGSMGLVFGLKDDADEYEAALLRHASEKYDKKFSAVEDLPDEYLLRVLEAHRVEYTAPTAGETPTLTGVEL